MERFDLGIGTWSSCASMTLGRRGHSAVAIPRTATHSGSILVIGGLIDDGECTRSVERYCLRTKKWFAEPDLALPMPLCNFTAAYVSGSVVTCGNTIISFASSRMPTHDAYMMLYAIGGMRSSMISTADCFALQFPPLDASDHAHRIGWRFLPSLPSPLRNAASVVIAPNRPVGQ